MKSIKFILLTFLLLFARGCDFYSTSLWFFQKDGYQGETNPLVSVLGFGWGVLLISNIIICLIIVLMCYSYYFKYKIHQLAQTPKNYKEYTSLIYFNTKNEFLSILYKIPKNRKVFISHLGLVLIKVIIVGSLLATVHNFCQFYNVSWYNSFREIVIRPLFVIYGLIILSILFFYQCLLVSEYNSYKIKF